MKTWVLQKYGSPKQAIELVELDTPVLRDNEVLVQNHACSLNPVDFKIAKGQYKLVQRLKFPARLGYDFAGIVLRTGSAVQNFKEGDRVFGCLPARNTGSFSEFVSCPENAMALAPRNIDLVSASALPLAGMTALQCIEAAKLEAGQIIFIHAGSGGVGTLAIQMAKAKGLRVITTTSSKNSKWLSELGADVVIEYDREDYLQADKVHALLDSLGGEHSKAAVKLIHRGGTLVNIAGGIDAKAAKRLGVNRFFRFLLSLQRASLFRKLKANGINYEYILMQTNSEDLKAISEMVEKGQLKPIVDSVHDFTKLDLALDSLTKGRAKGKMVCQLITEPAEVPSSGLTNLS